ncbi:MAG: hypothetical protein JJU05_17915 [Verrucomicrobia bacterium]|nr:hypothetical protein [Verrucomicrobiota bacterium]MCH8529052.1 hypothetical protein [Kiritimatiellia bacterium]
MKTERNFVSFVLSNVRFNPAGAGTRCAAFLLLLTLFSPAAWASVFRVSMANVCFAERIGDNLAPAWNAPIDGDYETWDRPEAPQSESDEIWVSVSPEVIAADRFDWVNVEIGGLSPGQTVLIERFLVDNDQGIVNGNAVLVESHLVQEGYRPMVGDFFFNTNQVLDWDGTLNGTIETQLGMFGGMSNMAGEYVIRVSSPTDAFEPEEASLTIDEIWTSEYFYGDVVDEEGDPIPHAIVGLLQQLGSYSDILFAKQADEHGYYYIASPYFPLEVDLVAVAPGFVGPFQRGNNRLIDFDDELEHDIVLTPGTVEIAGRAERSADEEPIAGLPVTFLTVDEKGIVDGRLMTHTWTDANGEFSVMVTPDRWLVLVKSYEASSRNLLELPNAPDLIVDTTDGAQTGITISFVEADSVIGGTLRDEDGNPLWKVQMKALNRETGQTTSGYTLQNGVFTLPVTAGVWEVTPFSYDLERAGHPGARETRVKLTASNQSVEFVHTAPKRSAILEGTITYDSADLGKNGEPVGGLTLWAQNIVNSELNSVFKSTYNSNGSFSIHLSEGHWFVIPDPREAARRQLLLKNLPLLDVVHDDDEVQSIEQDIHVVDPEVIITVTILDADENPVPGIPMHAHLMTDPGEDTFDAFGLTNEDGVAYIPAKSGHWHLHISHSTLRRAGLQEIPEQHLMVSETCGAPPEVCSCPSVKLEVTVPAFTDEPPELTATRVENGGTLVIEGEGEPGRLYHVQGSFDLQDWIFVGRVIALGGEFKITDPKNTAFKEEFTGEPGNRIFYRLTLPEE